MPFHRRSSELKTLELFLITLFEFPITRSNPSRLSSTLPTRHTSQKYASAAISAGYTALLPSNWRPISKNVRNRRGADEELERSPPSTPTRCGTAGLATNCSLLQGTSLQCDVIKQFFFKLRIGYQQQRLLFYWATEGPPAKVSETGAERGKNPSFHRHQ